MAPAAALPAAPQRADPPLLTAGGRRSVAGRRWQAQGASCTTARLHAVQLLLNVRGDGLDLSAQFLLNLEPAWEHRVEA